MGSKVYGLSNVLATKQRRTTATETRTLSDMARWLRSFPVNLTISTAQCGLHAGFAFNLCSLMNAHNHKQGAGFFNTEEEKLQARDSSRLQQVERKAVTVRTVPQGTVCVKLTHDMYLIRASVGA